ncbi:MAG TPA: radical SAM family heme chaperone HemW [Planktothrix sp.]|jgi:oxygen-independent coproporphyrinogen-3 oxidase
MLAAPLNNISAMPVSAYIHIPFCSHKCDFCDFAAFAGVDHLEDEYGATVVSEICQRLSGDKSQLASVFYGGGTPGLVKPETIESIQKSLTERAPLQAGAEVSLETTPHSITESKARDWLALGINRLSIGIESLQDDELQAIGRDHTREQALAGVERACRAGFTNVSCDFMYALPTQKLSSWRHTLEQFAALADQYRQIKHVSAYGLHLANNSPLFSRFPKESPSYPDDEAFEGMYDLLVQTLESQGFYQYEVSNFARPGFQSAHNLAYWQNKEYFGFGVSAHRYVGGVRSSNFRSLARYMKDCLGDETREEIDEATRLREAIMLGLRMRAGIDLAAFEREFGFDLLQKNRRPLEKLMGGGFVELADGHLRITHRGVPVSNSIIAELI